MDDLLVRMEELHENKSDGTLEFDEFSVLQFPIIFQLAETRLENRKMRPHMELCFDVPLDGLVAEVQAIRQSMQMLHDKLEASR